MVCLRRYAQEHRSDKMLELGIKGPGFTKKLKLKNKGGGMTSSIL